MAAKHVCEYMIKYVGIYMLVLRWVTGVAGVLFLKGVHAFIILSK